MAVARECYYSKTHIRLPNPNPPGEEPPNHDGANPQQWYFVADPTGAGGRAWGQTSSGGSGAAGSVVGAGGSVPVDAVKWGFGKLRGEIASVISVTIVYALMVGIVGLIASRVAPEVSLIDGGAGWTMLVFFVLMPAYVSAFLDVAQCGGGVEVGSLFRIGRWGKAIPTSLVVGVLVSLGLGLVVLPGLIVAFLLGFAVWFATDDAPNPVEAVRGSFAMVRANLGTVIALVVISGLLCIVGAALCGIGLLVAVPVSTLAWTYAYLTMRGQYVQF